MQRKTALFDTKQEIGIVGFEGGKCTFRLDSWNEKEISKACQIVEFTLQNGFAFDIAFKKEILKDMQIVLTIFNQKHLQIDKL